MRQRAKYPGEVKRGTIENSRGLTTQPLSRPFTCLSTVTFLVFTLVAQGTGDKGALCYKNRECVSDVYAHFQILFIGKTTVLFRE